MSPSAWTRGSGPCRTAASHGGASGPGTSGDGWSAHRSVAHPDRSYRSSRRDGSRGSRSTPIGSRSASRSKASTGSTSWTRRLGRGSYRKPRSRPGSVVPIRRRAASRRTDRSCASDTPNVATSCISRFVSSTHEPARCVATCSTRARTWSPTPGPPSRETNGSRSRASWGRSNDPRCGTWRPERATTSRSTFRAPSSLSSGGRTRPPSSFVTSTRARLSSIGWTPRPVVLIADPHGDIEGEGGAGLRPDGSVWLLASDATRAPRITDTDGRDVLPSPAEPPPPGRAFRSFPFSNPNGDRIHAFVVTPSGTGPFPAVVSVHGGPEWHERDRFDPETQAFVDAGYAVVLVNYRGSTGYGVRFRRALIGAVCSTETEDIIAGLNALEREGVVDPRRVYWSGWSWGGCLGCFNAGVNPDRWPSSRASPPATSSRRTTPALPSSRPGTTPCTAVRRKRSP